MLSTQLHSQFQNGFNQTIAALGTTVEWTSADGLLNEIMVVGFRAAGKDDIAVVNAFGTEVRIITLAVSASMNRPAQFDVFMVHGAAYVVQAAHEVWLNDALIGFRCFCKGK